MDGVQFFCRGDEVDPHSVFTAAAPFRACWCIIGTLSVEGRCFANILRHSVDVVGGVGVGVGVDVGVIASASVGVSVGVGAVVSVGVGMDVGVSVDARGGVGVDGMYITRELHATARLGSIALTERSVHGVEHKLKLGKGGR